MSMADFNSDEPHPAQQLHLSDSSGVETHGTNFSPFLSPGKSLPEDYFISCVFSFPLDSFSLPLSCTGLPLSPSLAVSLLWVQLINFLSS